MAKSSEEKQKVIVPFSQKEMSFLTERQRKTGMSKPEMARKAILLYQLFVEVEEKGGKVFAREPTSPGVLEERELLFIL